jgi:hypothetical protein
MYLHMDTEADCIFHRWQQESFCPTWSSACNPTIGRWSLIPLPMNLSSLGIAWINRSSGHNAAQLLKLSHKRCVALHLLSRTLVLVDLSYNGRNLSNQRLHTMRKPRPTVERPHSGTLMNSPGFGINTSQGRLMSEEASRGFQT